MTRQTRPLKMLLAAIATLALATACPEGPLDPGPEGEGDALDLEVNAEYGALTDEDEDPDFGDEELAEDADLTGEEDTDLEDDIDEGGAEDAALTELEEQAGPDLHRLRVLVTWGHLRPAPADEATDWSGTLSVTNAAMRVKRLVAFDANDHIVRPRADAQTVEFVSHTKPHMDGLLVEVILHPALGTTPDTPAVLTLDTPPFQGELTLRPGMRLSHVVPVGDGNAVAYHVFGPDRDGCNEGLMAGRYTQVRETEDGRTIGRFKGRYIGSDGTTRGKIKGVWGERTTGAQVMFGKVINHDGEFVGILAGRYDNGRFRGRFVGEGREVKGLYHGLYRAAPVAEGKGMFRGRWSQRCGELPSEGTIEAHDEEMDAVDETLGEEDDAALE